MEALLESTIATREAAAAAGGTTAGPEKPESLPEPAPTPVEKELGNLVINESGEQKYIGEYFHVLHCVLALGSY